MKKLELSLKIFTVAAAVFSCIILGFDVEKPTQCTIEEQRRAITAESGYTVKEYEGKIAVFRENGELPLYVFDSPYIRDLPQYDRELLKIGLKAENNTQLLQILEDYDN